MGLTHRRKFLVVAAGILGATRALAQAISSAPRIALVDAAGLPEEIAEGRNLNWSSLLGELRKLGYVEGKTIVIDRWSGKGDIGGYAGLAREVFANRPAVTVTRGRTLTVRFAAVEKVAPIVMIGTVSQELRASLARPGGNVTGLYTSSGDEQLYAKELDFVREITRPNGRVAWFGTRALWDAPGGEAARKGAKRVGLALELAAVTTPVNITAIEAAFAMVRKMKPDVLLVSPATELNPHYERIAAFARAERLPSVGNNWLMTNAGILLSYGAKYEELYRRAAHYVDRILRGAKPGDLPIEQPSLIELTLNLQTANALGIKLPQTILLRADRVIE
jgi:putative ABC transport system substrate-binding protein